jgi:hypothetical protein
MAVPLTGKIMLIEQAVNLLGKVYRRGDVEAAERMAYDLYLEIRQLHARLTDEVFIRKREHPPPPPDKSA